MSRNETIDISIKERADAFQITASHGDNHINLGTLSPTKLENLGGKDVLSPAFRGAVDALVLDNAFPKAYDANRSEQQNAAQRFANDTASDAVEKIRQSFDYLRHSLALA